MTDPVNRFYAAIAVLAGHGHIKQRLIRAYEENLDAIDEDELPVSVRQAYSDLRQSMYRVAPLKGESPISASVRKMSPTDASDCASQVVELFRELSRVRDDGSVVLGRSDDDASRVPPFLIKSV